MKAKKKLTLLAIEFFENYGNNMQKLANFQTAGQEKFKLMNDIDQLKAKIQTLEKLKDIDKLTDMELENYTYFTTLLEIKKQRLENEDNS